MPLFIPKEDRPAVDAMRTALAQALVDLIAVHTHDPNSQNAKTAVVQSLSEARATLDKLGIRHSLAP